MAKSTTEKRKNKKKIPGHWNKTYKALYFYYRRDDPLLYVYSKIPNKHEWFSKQLTIYAQKHPEIFETED